MKDKIDETIKTLESAGVIGGIGFGPEWKEIIEKFIASKSKDQSLENFLKEYKILCEKHKCYILQSEEMYVRFLELDEMLKTGYLKLTTKQ